MKLPFLLTLSLLCGANSLGQAQTMTQNSAAFRADKTQIDSREIPTVSLARLLQLDATQIARLSQLVPANGSQSINAPGSVVQSEAATRKMATDWRRAQDKARASLSPVQRSQLDSLVTDPRFRLLQDDLYRLLVAPIAAQNPSVSASRFQARRNQQERQTLVTENARGLRGTGSYGVYGGAGRGGPQVGVYGGYQQGAVGVYGGLGRGGPSIGVNIGRVFGFGRR